MEKVKNKRQLMISGLQDSLKVVRKVLDLSAQDVADAIGQSRQTICKVETRKTSLTPTQYISICALLDREIKKQEGVLPQIKEVLKARSQGCEKELIQMKNDSFIEGWFGLYEEMYENANLIKSKILDEVDLNILCENYKIFFTDDIFDNEGVESFIFRLIPYLKDANNIIFIPKISLDNIKKKLLTSEREEEIKKGKRARNILMTLERFGLLKIKRDSDNKKVDEFLVDIITKQMDSCNIALFTANNALMEKVLSINNIKTAKTSPIIVCGISENGEIERKQESDKDWDLKNLKSNNNSFLKMKN